MTEPTTYEIDGRQFVVIAAGGGGKPGTRSGDDEQRLSAFRRVRNEIQGRIEKLFEAPASVQRG